MKYTQFYVTRKHTFVSMCVCVYVISDALVCVCVCISHLVCELFTSVRKYNERRRKGKEIVRI